MSLDKHREYLSRITEDELLRALSEVAARGLKAEAVLLAAVLRLSLTPERKPSIPTDAPPF